MAKQTQYTIEREYTCRICEKELIQTIINAHAEKQYPYFPLKEKKQEVAK